MKILLLLTTLATAMIVGCNLPQINGGSSPASTPIGAAVDAVVPGAGAVVETITNFLPPWAQYGVIGLNGVLTALGLGGAIRGKTHKHARIESGQVLEAMRQFVYENGPEIFEAYDERMKELFKIFSTAPERDVFYEKHIENKNLKRVRKAQPCAEQ